MGCNNSSTSQDLSTFEILGNNFTQEDLDQVRGRETEKSVLAKFPILGTNGATVEPRHFPQNLVNICLMCINSKNAKGDNDITILNDGIFAAQHIKKIGYPIYYLINPSSMLYFTFLRLVLSHTSNNIILYVNGFCHDIDNDNLICFPDEEVPCRRFSSFLLSYKQNLSKVSLFFDVGHIKEKSLEPYSNFVSSEIPLNVVMVVIGFISTSQYGNQKIVKTQGYLTYSIFVALHKNPNKTFNEVENEINAMIQQTGYKIQIAAQNNETRELPVMLNVFGRDDTEEMHAARLLTSHNNNQQSDSNNEPRVEHIENVA